MRFQPFHVQNLEELMQETEQLGLKLPFSTNTGVLGRKVEIDGFTLPNSLATHPMEGSDANADGSPGELTLRKYGRLSAGGAGLIWLEAVSVVPEGRASPRQLYLHAGNRDAFAKLSETIAVSALRESGNSSVPLSILQLTHSGRFSRPDNRFRPIIATHNPYLDPLRKVEQDQPIISDQELEELENRYAETAVLAQKAGFHGVDVKACHGYLGCELLSAYTREGRYGGSFEGRTRFLLNTVEKIRQRTGKNFIIAARLNIYDGIPYPYGWGQNVENPGNIDLGEPICLVRQLCEKGVRLFNLTMGIPYYNPHVNRPYDKGGYIPPEHPLEGVSRLINGIGEIQRAVPEAVIVGTGYSWLRDLSPYVAAGALEQGMASVIGYGRQAFAYPDFARDILDKGKLAREKCCISCGKCAGILRAGGTAGCVIRDAGVYGPLYRQYCPEG